MSISRKEDGVLKKKAGIGIIDNILNKFSNHAVSNKAVTEAITEINNDLSEFKFRNNDGVPEFSMNNGTTWIKLGGGNMIPDFSKPITITSGTAVTKDCVVFLSSQSHYASSTFSVNGHPVVSAYHDSNNGVQINGYTGGSIPLKAGDVPTWNNFTVTAFAVL